ncbi:MAG: Hsp70 family protein [Deltaproteobacteria bacterium]|nr:Hsp70 family protein [Deltaproteobacteria bacterium]
MGMRSIGIDLGTSNTLVARINSDGQPVIVEIDNYSMVPSVVYIEETAGNKVVGNGALEMWADPSFDPVRSFRRWKLQMGEDHASSILPLGGTETGKIEVSPERLTTYMVEYVVEKISHGDDGEEIESILVTVPHGWRREKPEKCRATRMAAEQARFNGQGIAVQKITVSEPVAAAAYWLWITRKNRPAEEFVNKTMMVCDIGGGTFDISLVLIGDIDKPLDVIDAINNDIAGDYADALICALVCKQFNQQFKTEYPENADEILLAIEGNTISWLRTWFLDVKKQFKEKFSVRAEQVTKMGKSLNEIKPFQHSFVDGDGNHLQFSMGFADFLQCLEPFFEEGKKLLRTFLEKVPAQRLPYAVVFAGGGSRITGVKEKMIAPVLQEFFKGNEADEVLKRIEPNSDKLDRTIALGAALIANGVVSVQERLLHDIGIIGSLDNYDALRDALNLPKATEKILLTPIIKRGEVLPAKVTSSDLGLSCAVQPGESLDLDFVIDDDSQDPWVQHFVAPHPATGARQSLEWIVEADTDGALTIHLQPKKGQMVSVQGRLERKRTGRATIVLAQDINQNKQSGLPRVSPTALIEAMKKLGGKQ